MAPGFVSAADELKNKTVCENQTLKLHCHESKFLNIYSATYGRQSQERHLCAAEAKWLPPFGECELRPQRRRGGILVKMGCV